jgi:hypothetical protein
MFHSSRRRAELSAYDYNLQATEDQEEVHGHVHPSEGKRRVPRGKRPNYKPTALTWPFIVAQILVMAVAAGLIVWAMKAMPDSDNTAIIDPIPSQAVPGRSVRAEFGREFKRDNTSTGVETTQTRLDMQSSKEGVGRTTPSISGTAETTDVGTTPLTSAVHSMDPARTDEQGSTTVSNPLSSITSSTATGSSSPDFGSSGAATSTGESNNSGSSTTFAGDSSSDDRATSSGTQRGSSIVTGIHSTTGPGQSGSTTQTRSASSSGSPSASSQGNRDGRISIFIDPAATGSTISLVTSIFTSEFTTTAKYTMNITSTITIPEHTTTFNVTRSTVITTGRTRTGNFTLPPITVPVSYTVTKTYSSTAVYSSTGFQSHEASTTVLVSVVTSVGASFTVIAPTTVASEGVEPTTITSVTVFPSTSEIPATTSTTVVQTYVPYLSTGQTVITSVATVVIQPPQTQAITEAPVTIVGTSVGGGQVHTVIESFAPQTKVVGDTGGPVTHVATPPPQTIISQVGGSIVTNYIVVTPTPTTQTVSFSVESTFGGESRTILQTQTPQTIVTSQGGSLVTLISTPPPRTLMTVVGGTLTTIPLTSTSSGFKPISYVITTNIGSASTSIVVSTPSPTKVVTTINGTPVTFDTTFPPTTYTTTFGGTQVTQTTVTTPTGADPITLTFASTISGTLTTVIQTFPPTTFLTSLSGHLSTITTTPSPSTYLSTAPLSTTTFTSTTALPSLTTSSPPAQTSLIVTTKTYNLSAREYFIGTFLPPLLAVALVIPLRIIDLNAKLYQPFNSLSGGASGYDALTLQFTGLMGFVTPAVTLMQGRPVPFITTLTVVCASLMVPLAVEAVSLKLHGRCSPLSSQGCAAALGVSPASAHALLALTAAVAVLLCLLLFFLRRWTTGLHANPWNIAGIASLARNPDVRIRAAADDDASVRMAVADKTYGLGYYETPDGREEYGLLLADDSGRGLSGGPPPPPDAEGPEEDTPRVYRDALGRRRPKDKPLPFMTLRYPWRVCFVVYLAGLLVLIAYYDYTLVAQVRDPTVPRYTHLHLFLDSHDFGIRFLFAGLGVIITFCWQAFFVGILSTLPFPPKTCLISQLLLMNTLWN